MKKILLIIVICILSIALVGCNNSKDDGYINGNNNGFNGGNNNYKDNTPSYYVVQLNSNNVGNYFSANLEIVEKYYDTGYVLHYKITIIQNCLLVTSATLKFKVTAAYNTSSSFYQYKAYGYPTILVNPGMHMTTYNGTISLSQKVKNVNINLECVCTSASGSVKIYK